jgi:hypothetical protein
LNPTVVTVIADDIWMQGLMEAGKDPAVLAQLLKDMQVGYDSMPICKTSSFIA